jgi:hypothetical protein
VNASAAAAAPRDIIKRGARRFFVKRLLPNFLRILGQAYIEWIEKKYKLAHL